jgi:hypothetical protein
MVCPTANMDDCTKKCKCVGGPCANRAYDCADPCGVGTEFNAATCNCDLVANFIGAWGYDSGLDSRTASAQVVNIVPYYDGLGRLVTYTAGVSELSCGSQDAFDRSPCGQVPEYSGAVSIAKIAPCTGGGNVGNQYIFVYVDGVLNNLTYMNTAVALACDNTLNDFNSGTVGWFYGDTEQEVQDQLDAWIAGSGPPSQ